MRTPTKTLQLRLDQPQSPNLRQRIPLLSQLLRLRLQKLRWSTRIHRLLHPQEQKPRLSSKPHPPRLRLLPARQAKRLRTHQSSKLRPQLLQAQARLELPRMRSSLLSIQIQCRRRFKHLQPKIPHLVHQDRLDLPRRAFQLLPHPRLVQVA